MRLSQAELELIETVRHWDAKNFTLTIRVDKGRWNASLEDHDRDLVATGMKSRRPPAGAKILGVEVLFFRRVPISRRARAMSVGTQEDRGRRHA